MLPAKIRFFKHWFSMTEEQRAKEFGDDKLYQVSLQEIKGLGLPANVEDLEQMVAAAVAKTKTSIEHANEYIKLRMKVVTNPSENAAKYQEIAIAALESDLNKGEKVKAVENLMRRVVKSGSDGALFKA